MAITDVLAVLAMLTQLKKGHFHDTRNSGYRWHGTDNGLWLGSAPTVGDGHELLTEGPVVIDYFAIGVLVLIALLAVARLFPPPDRAQ